MLSLATARALREAGLTWEPAEFDTFAIPDRDMDDGQFVLNTMPAHVMLLDGVPVMAFAGAAEWALDYIAAGEVIWLPSEEQLRLQLTARLGGDPAFSLGLATTAAGCRCTVQSAGHTHTYTAADASEAYAAALLAALHAAA
jgi:hypothetical protein